MISNWPKHPFNPQERIAFAEILAARAHELPFVDKQWDSRSMCEFYGQLVDESNAIFGARSDGTAKCAVVAFSSTSQMTAVCAETIGLLLGGFSITIVAPRGPALDAAVALVDGFPAELLRVA